MRNKKSKVWLASVLTACLALAGLVHQAQASPYAKYAGTTLVVNFPSHPYYEYAIKLLPEFIKETGIKVEIDKIEYMKMRDKQLLEMSKPKGDYDLVSYVVMWKTEYVNKGLLTPLAPFFTHPDLADPNYDAADIVPAYLQTTGMAGGKGISPRSDSCLLWNSFRIRNEHVRLPQRHLRQVWLEGSADVR